MGLSVRKQYINSFRPDEKAACSAAACERASTVGRENWDSDPYRACREQEEVIADVIRDEESDRVVGKW